MKVRKEVHTRRDFAEERGTYWFHRMIDIERSGNIFTAKAAYKYAQARKIVFHYMNEYQRCTGLPLHDLNRKWETNLFIVHIERPKRSNLHRVSSPSDKQSLV